MANKLRIPARQVSPQAHCLPVPPSDFADLKQELQTSDWRVFQRLESFRSLRQGWDSYDAEPPGDVAIANARRILHVLWSGEAAPPLRQISPSVEGGVAVVFTGRDKKYADIECFNNGDILAITSDGATEPSVWSITKEGGSIRSAIEKINVFFND